MPKKSNLSTIFLICVICFSICVIRGFAEEQITITTYYPSPYGSYQDLEARRSLAVGYGVGSNQRTSEYWDNFATVKTAYGDSISIGGDAFPVGRVDTEVRIWDGYGRQNRVAFWNRRLWHHADIGTGNIFTHSSPYSNGDIVAAGNIITEGYLYPRYIYQSFGSGSGYSRCIPGYTRVGIGIYGEGDGYLVCRRN